MKNSHKFICLLNLWRVFPIYCIVISLKSKSRLFQDLQAWKQWKEIPFTSHFLIFLYLMSLYKEFRNIVYKRIGKWSYCVKWFCPPLSSLYIHCNDIGGGLLIHNVEICCGAKVLGGIYVGDNAVIGANAVVVKDVPAKAVMAGVPAKQIK